MASVLVRALANLKRPCVSTSTKTYTYESLLARAHFVSQRLKASERKPECVCVLAEGGPDYVAATWAGWLSGRIVVPLAPSHPNRELEYFIKDCEAVRLLHCREHEQRAHQLVRQLGIESIPVDVEDNEAVTSVSSQRALCANTLEEVKKDIQSLQSKDGALIVYTSGTTGKPKGAVHTHDSLHWQMQSMSEAWLWQPSDSILHCLPLHHIHGIVNALHCAHFNAAHVQFLQGGKFSPRRVWDTLIEKEDISVFMGVPTMYSYLLSYLDQLSDDQKSLYDEKSYYQRCMRAARRLRLAVCGSSACPVPLMNKWKGLSGQFLLERYGMSETGMILSNPYETGKRIEGTVGEPMPYVKVKVVQDGELLVRSKCMMSGYYKKPKQTREAFMGAYFRTGDQVSVDSKGVYTIKGRISMDIIKHKGYKISALDVENCLLGHPLISECSVVGLSHEVYGQSIAAVVVKADAQVLSESDLNSWCSDVLAPYQCPTTIHFVEQIPRNAMGKVNKKELTQWIHTLSK